MYTSILTHWNKLHGRVMRPLMLGISDASHPANHRYPVWWTGDGVPLMASVVSMVDEAVHDFRATVHSDCGGHGHCISNATRVVGAPPPSPNE